MSETLYHVHTHVVPAAMALLPGRMNTPEARAMLLAIGLQESKFQDRVQVGGPARGFWQFERGGGVKGVLTDVHTAAILVPILHTLRYPSNIAECYTALAHNDTLACVFARLLLWSYPATLPSMSEVDRGWTQYAKSWRPGKPHPETWPGNFAEGWRVVTSE